MNHKSNFSKLVLITFALLFFAGCASYPDDIADFIKADKISDPANYVLQPPDEIEIHSSKVPEVHLQRQQIRPDGKVTFEALGEIHAAGKTPGELAEIIKEKIMRLYALTGENPVDVRIVAFRSKRFYVFGEVLRPGAQLYTGEDTLLAAMAEALPTVLAWEEKTKVLRPSTDANVRPKTFQLNFKDMMVRGDLSRNVMLEEGDVIYVPPTILAAIAQVVEEFVRPIGSAFSTVNIVQRAGSGPRGGY